MDKRFFFYNSFFSLDKIPKIKMCHMVAKEHPEAIEGRRKFIAVDVLYSEESDEYDSIGNDGTALDEENGSGLLGAGVTEEVEDMHNDLKYSSLSYYILKHSHLLTHSFENNRTKTEKVFKHMCNFGAREKWR